jgi:DME family drug/metabolite transporter
VRQPCPNLRPQTRILLAGMLFATAGAFLKNGDFPSLQRAGVRAVIAAVTMFLLLPEARRRPDRATMLLALPYFGATCFFVISNTLTTAANAIFLQAASPLWVTLLGPLLLRERAQRSELLMLSCIGVGMALFFFAPASESASAPSPRLGDMFAIASGVCFALVLLGMRSISRRDPTHTAAAIAWGNAFTAPLSFALMPIVGQSPVVGDGSTWLTILFLGTCQVGLAYALLVRAMPHVGAVQASLLLMIEPALNPLLAYFVHGERPHWLAVLGGVLIVGSVTASAVVSRRRLATPREEAQ